MNIDRAEEIVRSKGVVEVIYKSDSVWIESLDELSKTAKVKVLNSKKEFEVPVDELNEGNTSLKF
jgi:H-type small acid-soluble spore protein